MNENSTIYKLSDRSSSKSNVIELIEKAFEYNSKHHFETDFYPLIADSNLENFFFIEADSTIVATIGCKKATLNAGNAQIPILLIGGIATHEAYKGKGYATLLIKHVISKYEQNSGLFLLWSDLGELYLKFNFHQTGRQYVYHSESEGEWLGPFKWPEFSDVQQQIIISIHKQYIQNIYCTCKRNKMDWSNFRFMNSVDWYLSKDHQSYFCVNKGQDLINIIHEFAGPQFNTKLAFPRGFELWSPVILNNIQPDKILYACLAREGNAEMLGQFLNELGFSNREWNEIFIQNKYPFFISGLESI